MKEIVPETPKGRRSKSRTDFEWVLIKDSIDMAREGCHTYNEVYILDQEGLWDKDNDCLDEEAVRKLYMEYT